MGLWDLIGAQHGRSGSRRRKRHPFSIGRIGGDVEEARQGARRLPEGRMFGHVLHQIAVDENAPVVTQGAQIFGTRAQRSSNGFAGTLALQHVHSLSPLQRLGRQPAAGRNAM